MIEKFRSASIVSRIITGLFLLGILASAWYYGGMAVEGLVAVIVLIGFGEFIFLFFPRREWITKILGLVLAASYVAAFVFLPKIPSASLLVAVSLVLAICSVFAWSKTKSHSSFLKAGIILCGIVYVPVFLCPAIRFNPWEQLLAVLIPAASDIAAYFTGVSFGRHPIWPSVSPKKSVEGAISGLLASILVSLVLGFVWGKVSWVEFAVLGLVMGIMAQFGDFFESAIKRAANAKDSGKLLPGHGGVLDRIDSILFCIAAYSIAREFIPFFG